jgi:LysM repeat protein
MKSILLFLIAIFFTQNTFAQKGKYIEVEMITHPVQMGETIRTISQKYLVEPGEIYQFNKYAVNGIKQGMTLLIPVPVKDPIVASGKKIKPKNNVAQVDNNQEEKIAATPKSNPRPVVTDNSKVTEYTIEPKETLYSLSKKFNISIDELKLANPSLETSGVQIGMLLKIPSTRTLDDNESSIGSTNAPVVEAKPKVTSPPVVVSHTVVAKETLYSLAKKYEVPLADIIKQNPTLNVSGLKIGMVLTITK